MKRHRVGWGAAAALPLLAIGLALAGCGKTSAASSKTGVSAPAKAKPAATVYTCPMHPDVKSSKPGKCPKCGMNLMAKKVAAPAKPAAKAKAQPAVYTCPMHPDVKSSKPGKCPKCGMTLELKKTAALPMTAPAAAALAAKRAVALQDPQAGSGCTMAPGDMSSCPTCAAKSGT